MNSNKKISTIIFIFSLVILALIIFGVWPLIEKIKKDSGDLILIKNIIATHGIQVAEIESFKNNYGNYKNNIEKINQLFINPQNPVEFIKFLENTAYNQNLNMQISISNPNSEINKNFVFFHLTIKGDFSDILLFINKIENGPYLIEVKDLTIQNQENNQQAKDSREIFYKNTATLNIKVFTKNEIEI